jgi:O-glycosyl hydrolase
MLRLSFARATAVRFAVRPVTQLPKYLLAAATALLVIGCGGSSTPATPPTPTAAAPTFSPAGGSFTTAQTVMLSDATTGASIYYTLDGSTPTISSSKYSSALTVSTTTTVTAIAVAPSYNNSTSASATYSILAATPTFTPAAGTYTSAQAIGIADTTTGATIYYTLDGSTPTASSMKYTAPFVVSATTTVNAVAIASGLSTSAVASALYTINLPPAATPVYSPAAGTYTSAQTVSITDATAGATIYYTLDGSTPTANSARYAAPISVSTTTTINSIALASSYTASAVASGTFTINLPAAATPAFSPVAGTYTSAQTVSIVDATTGAAIYYTLDGSTPTTASARYAAPLTVSTTTTIKAIATATNYTTSAVGTGTFTINLPAAATPTFSPAAGTYTSAQTVSILDATTSAAIYYTLDGSTPTTASAHYTIPIPVSSTETINAIATATGYSQSAVGSGTFTINLPAAATPTFSVTAGTFTSTQMVSLSDTTTGAAIYYTLDGSTPTTSSAKYTAAISVASTETIKAIATATGYSQSAVASATYTINLAPAATPTFSPAPGTYTSFQTVTLADTTSGATIYYTLDGSTPTTSSAKYTATISVTATETINAIATATGYSQSAVATGTYTLNLPAAATPTFTPVAGSYASAQSVTIADTTSGATIYYTLDGSTPTTNSTKYTAAINVASTETINAIATASGYTTSAVGTAAYTFTATNVAVTLSTYDSASLLAPQAAVQFTAGTPSTTQLIIDENQQFQSIEGFGASFTDAAAYDLEEVETASLLPGTLSDLFTRTGNGIGLTFMRNPIGASDMARTIYTFDDVASGQTDMTLSSFSIAHDNTYIIPLIKAAKALNPSMKILASPWSPPAWMKAGASIEGGTLNTTAYTYLANYLVKYLQAYSAAGAPMDYLTVQNEPLNQNSGYPTMYMDEPTQLTVIRDYMLPALATAGLTTKVMLYDHNWDTPSYPASLLADSTLLASSVVVGTAWHGYSGPPGAQLGVQNQYPTKGQWETEHSGGTFIGNQFISDFNEITLVMRSASKSYVKWNLALDQNRGPNTSQLGGSYTGCNTCSGIITVNSTTGTPTKTIEYYTLGQYSKFILPGAIRVYSSDTPDVVSSAYINPDGTRVLVAFNNSFASTTFQVQWGSTQNFSYTLSAYAAATFVWSGTQTGTPTQSATQQIQGASFNTATGLEVEETTDATGSYDLGYVVDGATVDYKNVSFPSTGVSKVMVRVASGGSGGTVEFHLDSATGTLLGTATLPVTGGYQTWQTVTQAVTSATGLHDVYMVIHGSGSIGNVNWFQFQ